MVIVLMGVSGSGKTTIGKLLAEDLGWPFYDADAFHPPANIQKMARGIALTDADRLPWLEAIRKRIQMLTEQSQSAVVACSALKRAYREVLLKDNPEARLVYLKGDYALIEKRLKARRGHFMKAGLLSSQFAALEEPKEALVIDISQTPDEIVRLIRSKFGL